MFKNGIFLFFLLTFGFIFGQDPYVINNFDSPENATDVGDNAWWTEYDETAEAMNFSTLTQVPADQAPNNDSPVMDWSYGVVGTFGWGGYTGALNYFDQAVDLSAHNYLSFKFYNLTAPQIGGVTLRVILFDVSDATTWSSRDEVEVWYSFFEGDEAPMYNSSDDGWVEYRIPLQGSGTTNGGTSYTQGFTRTGWVGIAGNNTFDASQIGGISIEVVSTTQGATLGGEFLIEDIQAIYSADISGCTDVTACNYDPDATVDDGSCYQCSDITFRVDMTQEETHPEGVYLAGGGFGQDGHLMDDSDGDDIWTVTLPLEVGTTHLYKFRNQPSYGTWNGFEPADGLVAGGCNTGQYNDRYVDVPDTDTVLDIVCYGACVDCSSLALVNVTFSVNMEEVETSPGGVWLAGGTFGGNPGYLMSDTDNDDIWTITLPANPDFDITYKFVNGPIDANWQGDWENVPTSCAVGDNNDREFSVGAVDVTVPTVCFSACQDCLGNYPIDVTFNLDMSEETGFDGTQMPYVLGSFNNWDQSSALMLSDENADNIYSATQTFNIQDSVTLVYGYGTNYETVPDECSIYDSDTYLNVRPLPLANAAGQTELNLEVVKYEQCPVDNTPRALFQVDVSSIVDQWPPDFSLCVTGSFDNWSGCGLQLTDTDGDNVYSGVVTDLTDGASYEYKFLVNQQWNNDLYESGAPLQSPCDFNNTDSYNNYGFVASAGPAPTNLGVHPWQECPLLHHGEEFNELLPKKFSYSAYPNPFNPYVNISYNLPNADQVEVSIVNLLGQKVKTLVNDFQSPGAYLYKWDGRDNKGVSMQSGIYFAIINHQKNRNILKITYLK